MNAENIKSELQQVLDNDLAIRKEFSELKRSLNDYRNQLILRDEDCKRLQVTIDVLSTKLEVMERDNINYKEELTSLLELRDSSKEQLQAKQEEIEARLSEIEFLKNELDNMSAGYETQLQNLQYSNNEELERITQEYNAQLQELKNNLRDALEEQRSTLTHNFNSQIERLTNDYTEKENQIVSNYEAQLTAQREAATSEMQNLKEVYEAKLSNLIAEYEEKLANTILHSNNQNFKLNEEVKRLELSSGVLYSKIEQLEVELEGKNAEISGLSERFENLTAEHENLKQTSLSSSSEQVNDLQNQVESLSSEMQNMGVLFEENTNKLAEVEKGLEDSIAQISTLNQLLAEKEKEVENLKTQELQSSLQIESLNQIIAAKDKEVEDFKSHWQAALKVENETKDLDFQKLLAENSNLISEIEDALSKNEAYEAEISILKAELEEMRTVSMGRIGDLKETLSHKNFEITNLEANNAALLKEIEQLKQELQNTTISAETSEQVQDDGFIDRLFKQIDELSAQRLSLLDEKEQMAAQILKMNEMLASISQQVDSENIDVNDLNNHRMNVILAAQSEGTNNQKSPMKEQINDLVREIDKCIALLSA